MEDPFSTAFGVRLPRVCGELLEAPHDPTSGRAVDRQSRQLAPELRQPPHLLPRRGESSLVSQFGMSLSGYLNCLAFAEARLVRPGIAA
jgi:hypothetical protein